MNAIQRIEAQIQRVENQIKVIGKQTQKTEAQQKEPGADVSYSDNEELQLFAKKKQMFDEATQLRDRLLRALACSKGLFCLAEQVLSSSRESFEAVLLTFWSLFRNKQKTPLVASCLILRLTLAAWYLKASK